uniref:Prolamin-like domain-containing protein n=1 Tax=Brassica campestris TaxID=3711 RepID=A0A3P5ZTF2_BRACM|nr:unnamed protein product [Brassica rapa]
MPRHAPKTNRLFTKETSPLARSLIFPTSTGLPRGSFGLFHSVLVSQSAEPENCLTGDKSKVGEKCLSQIFSSWAGNNFSLDKECCELVLNMDKKFRSSLFLASGGGLNLELSCG